MEPSIILPNSAGQICKISIPLEDEDANDVYVITEDPTPFDDEDFIYVVNLKDLQRNISNPSLTTQLAIAKCELTVIADDLQKYIQSYNK
jgi:hypothetical protein